MLRLFVAGLIVTAQTALVPPRPTGAIAGRAVDIDTGRPIPGAIITMMGAEHPRAIQTDGDGRFRLVDVPSGAVLFASKRGYLDWSEMRYPSWAGNRVLFQAGETRRDVVVTLIREAVISGRIVDESGDPVVGLDVTVLSRTYVAGRPVFRRIERHNTSRTDDRGQYRVAGLSPGEYLIAAENVEGSIPAGVLALAGRGGPEDPVNSAIYSVSQLAAQGVRLGSGGSLSTGEYVRVIGRGPVAPPGPDGRFRSYPTTFHPGATLAGAARSILVRAGEERTDVDIQLRPVTTVRVSGTVSGPRGALSHLPLYLMPGTTEDWSDDLPIARTMTNESGAFTFPGVPPGQYRVHVLKTPAPPRDTDAFEFRAMEVSSAAVTVNTGSDRALSTPLTDPAAADMIWSSTGITVGDRDVSGVTIEAVAGARISGRVMLAAASEQAKRAQEAGVTIVFERADGHDAKITQSPNPFRSAGWAMSEPDGTFHTRPLPPGPYLARIDSPTWALKSALLGSLNVADVPVELRAQDITGVIFNITDALSEVSGTVRAAAGARLDRLAILAFPVDRSRWSDFGITPWRIRAVTVKADGEYELARLPAGEYYIAVVDDAIGLEQVSTSRLSELAATATRLTLGDGERKRLNLQTATRR